MSMLVYSSTVFFTTGDYWRVKLLSNVKTIILLKSHGPINYIENHNEQ